MRGRKTVFVKKLYALILFAVYNQVKEAFALQAKAQYFSGLCIIHSFFAMYV